ncbi:MAG TPA: hypothetical protein VHX16_16570 [Chloroflexota bacterium]|jgi:hypothetical protein|nr:hypothetical protein [Chloroflexota bacterium]
MIASIAVRPRHPHSDDVYEVAILREKLRDRRGLVRVSRRSETIDQIPYRGVVE